MSSSKHLLRGQFFMNGDIASAEGALAAGCRFFGGYPITPATEIAERMAERMHEVGGVFIQMEDELAAMNSIIGAAWGGAKTMTSTSGPGFSLIMENLGLAIMTETPCVVVDVQRCGPSTGLPTLVGQQDMMQARWGSHGDYEIIALTPNSPQEMFDMTVEAFNLSERFRTPVLLMADEVVGHMMEKVVIPPVEELQVTPRRTPASEDDYLPYRSDAPELVPPMGAMGEGYFQHITGLTHDERGYPVLNAETQAVLMQRLVNKIRLYAHELVKYEAIDLEGADVAVVTYGISSRTSMRAIKLARRSGLKVGMLRLQIVWPFPDGLIAELAGKVGAIVVPEINMGQIVREVQRAVAGRCPVLGVPHPGGSIHKPEDIAQVIEQAARARGAHSTAASA